MAYDFIFHVGPPRTGTTYLYWLFTQAGCDTFTSLGKDNELNDEDFFKFDVGKWAHNSGPLGFAKNPGAIFNLKTIYPTVEKLSEFMSYGYNPLVLFGVRDFEEIASSLYKLKKESHPEYIKTYSEFLFDIGGEDESSLFKKFQYLKGAYSHSMDICGQFDIPYKTLWLQPLMSPDIGVSELLLKQYIINDEQLPHFRRAERVIGKFQSNLKDYEFYPNRDLAKFSKETTELLTRRYEWEAKI